MCVVFSFQTKGKPEIDHEASESQSAPRLDAGPQRESLAAFPEDDYIFPNSFWWNCTVETYYLTAYLILFSIGGGVNACWRSAVFESPVLAQFYF